MNAKVLEGLKYTKDHEWVKVEGNSAYIGITDYAQSSLGSIVYVELPDVDSEFEVEEAFGVVESVKAASDVFIPVSGRIIDANQEIVDDPALLNSDAFENWMIKVELADPSQLDGLLSADDYKKLLGGE
mgnify:CR=1 FL=1